MIYEHENFQQYFLSKGSLLIQGECGVGKNYFVKKLCHRFCLDYIHLNMAALSEPLIESELFGHDKGAFTGATSSRSGHIEKASGKVLFLDEIGEMSLKVQSKLLTLIEENIYIPVGSTKTKNFNGQFIFATNKDLKKEVAMGKFRQDLFYRLNKLSICLPSLRDDHVKLKELTEYFWQVYCQKYKTQLVLTDAIMNAIQSYAWPGNTRELESAIETMIAFSTGDNLYWPLPSTDQEEMVKQATYWGAVEQFEEQYLRKSLEKRQGKVNKTAREIGLSKVSLIKKMRKYKLAA